MATVTARPACHRAADAVTMLVPGEEEIGPQRRCTRCGCWWPAKDEAFWFRNHGGWHPWCRACHREARDGRWARKALASVLR